jgi:TPR repeat protein
MRTISLALSATLLSLISAFAQGPSPFAAPATPSTPSAPVAMGKTSTPPETGLRDLMQQIVKKADPLDEADLHQMERRAQDGSSEDQLAMGCLLSLGSAAQVTSPRVPTVNLAKAIQYFEMAARNGSPEAQLFLGVMNLRGQGIPADRIKGAMWINVASAAKLKPATREARRLKNELTRHEVVEAQRLASDWLAQHSRETGSREPAQ